MKYIQVPFNYNSTDILNSVENYTKLGPRPCTNAEIEKINQILKLKYPITKILFFAMGPKRTGEIHIDENLLVDDIPLVFGLNLPLLNAQHTRMSWWAKKDNNQEDEFNLGVYNAKFKILQFEQADCIESVFYTEPTIVDIGNYHNVENTSNKPAYFISLRFDEHVTKEMLINSLSNLN